jgi:hypothetical protein
MRRLAVVSAVLFAACASSQGPSVAPTPDQTVRVMSGTASSTTAMTMVPTDDPSQRLMYAPAAKVWNALPAVFDSLGFPITDRNIEARTLGTSSLKLRHRLGNVALSRYMDCGSTQGSPSADNYDVLLTFIAQLVPSGDSTNVTTRMTALARPTFVSGEYVNCGSTRTLEKRFFDLLNAEVRR